MGDHSVSWLWPCPHVFCCLVAMAATQWCRSGLPPLSLLSDSLPPPLLSWVKALAGDIKLRKPPRPSSSLSRPSPALSSSPLFLFLSIPLFPSSLSGVPFSMPEFPCLPPVWFEIPRIGWFQNSWKSYLFYRSFSCKSLCKEQRGCSPREPLK